MDRSFPGYSEPPAIPPATPHPTTTPPEIFSPPIVFIDPAVADYDHLLNGIKAGSEIHVLNSHADGIQQMAAVLARYRHVKSITIVAHGDIGEIRLGNATLDAARVEKTYRKEMQTLRRALAKGADLMLYSCNTGHGVAGRRFVETLASATGADVAASDDLTGAGELGGDWTLETTWGSVELSNLIDTAGIHYANVLGITSENFDGAAFNDQNNVTTYVVNDWTFTSSIATEIAVPLPDDFGSVYILTNHDGGASDRAIVVNISGISSITSMSMKSTDGTNFKLNSFDIGNIFTGGADTSVTLTAYRDGSPVSGSAELVNLTTSDSSGNISYTQLYSNPSAYAGTVTFNSVFENIDEIRFTFPANGALEVDNISISPAVSNTPPALGGTFTTSGSVNDNATTSPFSGVTITDADGDNVSVSITFTAANGTLSGTGITGSAGSYTVTSAAPATATGNLQGIVFTPTANQVVPGSTVATTFTLTPNDGTADGTADATTRITATAINDAPVITSNGGGATATTNINENTTAVTTVTQSDADTGETYTYSISGGTDAARFNINSSSGALTFASAPDYESPADNGSDNVYDVQVTVTDSGTGNLTDVQDLAVTVNNVNENPVIISDGGGASASANAAENQTAVTTVTAVDQDSFDTLTYSITGGADQALFSINSSSGVLTFASPPNYESPVDSGGNGVYDVQVTVTDNGAGNLTDVQAIAVTVTNANEAPVIISNGGGASATTNINENTTAVTTVTATDVDTSDTLTYSISGGADAALFSINSSSGALTFSSAPSFESPADSGGNNVYDVQVTVTDNGTGNLTDTQAIAVTVNNVNENPVITSNGGGASASVNATENQTAVTTVTAVDQDGFDTLTYSITGGADQAKFSINSSTGVLTFASPPNYESPIDSGGNGVYDVQVTVTDNGAGNLTDVQAIAVTVTNANEAPVITSNGGGASATANINENTTAVTTVTATDIDSGDTLTYSISGGADAARFNINSATGVLAFSSAPDYDAPADSGGDNVYNVQITVTDNGSGNLTDVQAIAVTVNNINDAPVITSNGGGTSASIAVNENRTAVTTVTASDPDSGDTLTYSISGGADAARFNINSATGILVFGSAPDYDTPSDNGGNNVYDVQITVTDNGSGNLTDVQAIAVTVNNVNENPVITSNGGGTSASIAVNENRTAVTTVTASDPDSGDTLTYSISGGADAAHFSINGGTGVLTFTGAPNYESPADSGGNNVYDVQVTVTDNGAGNLTDVQAIAVTVTDGNDTPLITSNGGGASASIAINENGTTVTTVTASDPDSGDTLTYSVSGGADAARFSINSATGTLVFGSAPDYESPTDSGGNNVYDVQVAVTDSGTGNLSDVQNIAVTVNDINDNPVITSVAITSVNEDTLYSYTFAARDDDSGDTLTLSAPTLPAWLSFNPATGVLSGTPGNAEVGAHGVVLRVNDGTMNVDQGFTLTVINSNDAPTVTGTPVTRAVAGVAYSFTISASDVDVGDTLSYVISNNPAWLSINSATGKVSGTPGSSDVGNNSGILVGASDGALSGYLAAFDITVVGDLDSDGSGDDVDDDIDGDGMSNDYEEANGLDKWDANDRDSDLDGDGVSNYDESVAGSDARVDDYPPVITPPADITVDATGLFTAVDIGTATATDGLDGTVTATSDAGDYFTPGVHEVTWSARDAANNSATAIQLINVIPLVELSKDQNTTEGATASFKVLLNGPAVTYPVVVPYTLSGTADGSDHDLVNGSATITAPNLATTVTLNLVDDGPGEGPETLVVTLDTPTNAVIGPKSTHTMAIYESNVSPSVTLTATQDGVTTRLTQQGGTNVVVSAHVNDPNPGDTHTYDWSASDNALLDLDSAADTFTFDPSTTGTFKLRVTVTDNGVGNLSNSARLVLNVVAALPSLTNEDTDEDGIEDDTEGTGDSDGDGVPDYLDSANLQSNVLQEVAATSDQFVIETEPGLSLQLGDVAFRANSGGSTVSDSEIATHGHDGAGAPADERYAYAGGVFDFAVADLPVAGQSVNLVIPQQGAIPGRAIYRKLMPFGWTDFLEDDNNRLWSAAGTQGYCPPPGNSAYRQGLTEGHWCVQLTIKDGGPNDADGEQNQLIQDPGGIATAVSTSVSSTTHGGGGGGGGMNPWSLLFFVFLSLAQRYYSAHAKVACRNQRCRVRNRRTAYSGKVDKM